MKNWLATLSLLCLFACKEKRIDLSGNTPLKKNDFIALFPLINSTFSASDTNITKIADTTIIGYKAIIQLLPDSTLQKLVPSVKKEIIQPVGRIEKQKEIYLLLNFSRNKKTQLIAIVLDKKYKYLAAKELLNNNNDDDYIHSVSINKEPTFLLSKEKINTEKQLQFTRIGWIYNNNSNTFSVVINDSNEDKKKTDLIINPIDTLPKKNKFSGNYQLNKKNFIAVRDGKDAKSYQFFIHFEKENNNCNGELKGVMKLVNTNNAIYKEAGDPCVINFSFQNNEITFKETGSCGNRRGIECLFNNTYPKKKENKTFKHK